MTPTHPTDPAEPNSATAPRSADSAEPQGAQPGTAQDVEGEGNYTAARRHRKSLEEFVEDGRVEPAAREAAPDSPQEEQAMRDAEAEGRRHARE